MANKTEYARSATNILMGLLQTWCAVVKHSSNGKTADLAEKLFPSECNHADAKADNVIRLLDRWIAGENLPTLEKLTVTATLAVSNELIPQNLSDSILKAYKNFNAEPSDGVDFFNLTNTVELFEQYILKAGEPPHLVNHGKALRYLVHGPEDENSQEFKDWLALYKPFFLACEKQNLDDFIELKLTRDVASVYEDFGRDSGSLEFTGISAGIKGLRALLPKDLGPIAQQVKSDTSDLMSAISIRTGLTHSQIAALSGQPKSLGEFLAAGEIIPRPTAYRAMECMAMLAETGRFDDWIECYNEESSSRS